MLTCREIAARSGLSEEFIRAACHRGKGFHPLPHIECGAKRPIFRISWDTFQAWLKEEEEFSVGALV